MEQALTRIEREVSIGKIAANANIGPKNYSHGLIEHAQGTIGHKIFFYIVMEYIDGETMLSWMQRTLRGRHTKCDQCGEISEVPVIPILLRDSIVLACRLYVAAMRQGIFQNDLKVSNVMFDIRGQVFLIDYGQAEKIREQSDFIRILSLWFHQKLLCHETSIPRELERRVRRIEISLYGSDGVLTYL